MAGEVLECEGEWKLTGFGLMVGNSRWVLGTVRLHTDTGQLGFYKKIRPDIAHQTFHLHKKSMKSLKTDLNRLVIHFTSGETAQLSRPCHPLQLSRLCDQLKDIHNKPLTVTPKKSRVHITSIKPRPPLIDKPTAKPTVTPTSKPTPFSNHEFTRESEVTMATATTPSTPSHKRSRDHSSHRPSSTCTKSASSFYGNTSPRSRNISITTELGTPPKSKFLERGQQKSCIAMKSLMSDFHGSTTPSNNRVNGTHLSLSSNPLRRRGYLSDPTNKTVTYSWQRGEEQSGGGAKVNSLQGFSNLGNTCYMNSILQSLFSIDSFASDLDKSSTDLGKDTHDLDVISSPLQQRGILWSLSRLLKAHQSGASWEKMSFLLSRVKRSISAKRFLGNEQHDAHEFLSQVLDQMKEEVITINKNDAPVNSDPSVTSEPEVKIKNPVILNFEFEVTHSIVCDKCGETVTKVETFNDLSLDMPRRRDMFDERSLQDALDQFFHSETLEYACERCEGRRATVSHKFTSLPRVLIVHLKRYIFLTSSAVQGKLRRHIAVPRYICLQSHCVDGTQPHPDLPHLTNTTPHVSRSSVDHQENRAPTPARTYSRITKNREFKFQSTKRPVPSVFDEVNGGIPGRKRRDTAPSKDMGDRTPNQDRTPSRNMGDSTPKQGRTPSRDIWDRTPNHGMVERREMAESGDRTPNGDLTRNGNMTPNWDVARNDDKTPKQSMAQNGDRTPNGDTKHRRDPAHENYSAHSVTSSSKEALTTDTHNTRDMAPIGDVNPSGSFTTDGRQADHNQAQITDLSEYQLAGLSEEDQLNMALRMSEMTHTADDIKPEPKSDSDNLQLYLDSSLTEEDSDAVDSHVCANRLIQVDGQTDKKNVGLLDLDGGVESGVEKDMLSLETGVSENTETRLVSEGTVGDEQKKEGRLDGGDGEMLAGYLRPKRRSSERGGEEEEGGELQEAIKRSRLDQPQDEEDFLAQLEKAKQMSLQEFDCVLDDDILACEKEEESEVNAEVTAEVNTEWQNKLRDNSKSGELDNSYQLVSIVNHLGSSSNIGHYVSDIYDRGQGAWFSCDDSTVKQTTQDTVLSNSQKTGYIFFYVHKDLYKTVDKSAVTMDTSYKRVPLSPSRPNMAHRRTMTR